MNEKEYAKEIIKELEDGYKNIPGFFGTGRDIFPGSELSKLDLNKLKEESNKNLYVLNLISEDSNITDLNSFRKAKDRLKLIYATKEKCLARKAYLYEIIK